MSHTATAADVAVVGGGIIGLVTAERLTARGLTVVVIDEAGIAGGATGASGGLVRAFDPSGHHPVWAAAGLEAYLRQGRHGTWPRIRDQGSLTLVARSTVPCAADAVSQLRAAGRKADVLSAQEISTRFPGLTVPDDLAGVYEPEAGWLPVRAVATAVLRDAGPELHLKRARATRLLGTSCRIAGVDTTAGPVHAPAVLLAAGVGSTPLAASVGVHLPLRTRSVGYCLFEPRERADLAELPTVVDRTTGAWLRPWGVGSLVLAGVTSEETDVPATVQPGVTAREEQRVRDVVRHRYPRLAQAPGRGGITAYDAMAPAGHGEVTVHTSPAGLVTATGWNGGGFKLAPAVGEFAAARLAEAVS
ncbi:MULTISPECIES: NAD(P)/FAD-dependent oxidoreductase [Streptomyces]|uniref:Oxidoreductase n=1 Tax=Streptomyces xanthochromogenes TaxID=67384 RepID=A0ABQ3AZL6_9ACTN|nr:FAD-binding oxidoreductase [Streptomyces xanthochromogenes]MYV95927.1 FAD-dependent oxidoreductase [Streptomyces sp. SID1034]GGY71364.1 oxidoreductase [Streptomyces xanthochromogenes]